MKKRSKKLNDASGSKASHQNRITIMKQMNKDLAIHLQTLKHNLAESAAQNSSLKAEIYDMMMERNSLMKEKMKLIDTLKNIAEVIGGSLNLRGLKSMHDGSDLFLEFDHCWGPLRFNLFEVDSDQKCIAQSLRNLDVPTSKTVFDPKGDRLDRTKQSATICPMVSGYAIHKPKVKLTRLNFNDYPSAANMQDNGYVINLSTIVEEDQIKKVFKRRLGQRSQLSQNVPCSSIIDYKQPIILLERHPIFSIRPDGSSQIDDGLNSEVEEKPNITPKRKTPSEIESKDSTPRSPLIKTEKGLNPALSGTKAKRRSFRIRKEVNYKAM